MTGKPVDPTDTVRPTPPTPLIPTPTTGVTTAQDAGTHQDQDQDQEPEQEPEQDPAPLVDRTFAMRFTSTPRGARLARRLTAVRLDTWGIPYGTGAHDEIVLIVAELTANAVVHGHDPGRDFHLRVHAPADGRTIRVEVSDARAERAPRSPAGDPETTGTGTEEASGGRGLLLVSRLAARWDWCPRPGAPGKTVWAEYAMAVR
ncbi:ATP-binding protein [Streptomyces cathayae]|uniref:ATP-binding protein n=1 Tax=Streptomyces cathayae TaxID=3031124 RepID=A0ABY8KAC8_9ACTN|nr:ATP-binding protein [Streptomyces sp. HUAS 5]WGD43267.1 ATP-binding protein [Streptomyces sp. HUAS 5]